MRTIRNLLIICLLTFFIGSLPSSNIYAADAVIQGEEMDNCTKPHITSISITSNSINMNWKKCEYASHYYVTYKIANNMSNLVTTNFNSLCIRVILSYTEKAEGLRI